MNSTPLSTLEPGMRLIVGGNRVVSVPPAIAERFRPGDSIVHSDATGELMHIPAAETRIAGLAVTDALVAFDAMRRVSDAQINHFYLGFAQRLASEAIWSRILEANHVDVEDARWVRLRNPRQTSDEVPSGKTSQSLADTEATGCDERSRSRSRGCPSSDRPSAGHSNVSEAASS